jgi:hypothetical protein
MLYWQRFSNSFVLKTEEIFKSSKSRHYTCDQHVTSFVAVLLVCRATFTDIPEAA